MKYIHKNKKRFGWGRRLASGSMIVILMTAMLQFSAGAPKAGAEILFVGQTTAAAAAVSASITVNKPAGVLTGHVMIASVMALPGTSNSVAVTPPAGWTLIGTAPTSNKYKLSNYYKVATGTEPVSYTFSFTPNSTAVAGIVSFSGVDTKSPVDVFAGQANGSSVNLVSPSVSTNFNTDTVLALYGLQANQTTTADPAGFTGIWNVGTTNNGISASYKNLTNSGATGTFTATTGISVPSLAQTVALKPSAATAGVQYLATQAPFSCAACTSITATMPSGWKAGDFFVTSVSWNTNTSTLAAPAGWTQIGTTVTTGSFAMANFYHFAVAGGSSTYNWTFSASTAFAMVSTVNFTGVDDVQPIDVQATGVSTSGTSHTAPNLTTTNAQDMLFDVWSWNTGTNADTISATMTKIWDAQTGNASSNVSTAAGYELLGPSGVVSGRNVTSGRNAIAMMHSIALKPFLPTPTLITPTNNLTTPLFPVFQLLNASLTSTPQRYTIQVCSDTLCGTILTTYNQNTSQVGWTGQDALPVSGSNTAYVGSTDPSQSTTATYTAQTALTPCTQYHWRGISYDTGTTQTSNPSQIATFKTSCIPSAPTLFSPGANSNNIPLNPQFTLASTDADGDYLQYRIELCANSTCSSIIGAFDQTLSQSGWSGQNDPDSIGYYADAVSAANSTKGFYSLTSVTLTPNTAYWWRATAKDPAGTNLFSASSPIHQFTTNLSETVIKEGRILGSTIL